MLIAHGSPVHFTDEHVACAIGFAVLLLAQVVIVVSMLIHRGRRNRAEQALRASQDRLSLVMDATTEGIWDWNMQTGEMFYSEKWCRSLGYDPSEVEPNISFWERIVHPDDLKRDWAALQDHIDGKTAFFESEDRLRTKSGAYRENLGRGRIVERDAKGRPLRMVGTDIDITERKQSELALRESEMRFGMMADSAPVMLWVVDTQGGCVFVNKQWLDFTGRTLEQDLGKGWADRIHPEDRQGVLDSLGAATTACREWESEYRLLRHDGEYRWILDRGVPRHAPDGTFQGMIGCCIDITKRKLADDAVHEREERFRLLFENSIDGILVANDEGKYVEANEAATQIIGYERETLCSMRVQDLLTPRGGNAGERYSAYVKKGSESGTFTFERPDGQLRTIEYAACRFAPGLHLSIMRDVTDRNAIAAALLESEAKFRAIAECSSVGIFQISPDRRVLYANPAICELLEVDSVESLLGGKIDRFYSDDTMETIRAQHALRLQGKSSIYEVEIAGARGARRSVIIAGTPIMTPEGAMQSMVATFTDITDRKQMELALQEANDRLEQRVRERTAALEESEERFQQLADAAFEGIAIHEEGRIIAANQAFADVFGYDREELYGTTRLELVSAGMNDHGDLRDPVDKDGNGTVYECNGIRRDGTTFPIELRGKWIPYEGRQVRVTTVRDITERKEVQRIENRHRDELAHVMRQITISELASGLAHELNQPLTAIANYARACLRRQERGGATDIDYSQTLGHIAAQSERAGEIIRRIRAFVRKGEPQRTLVDLNEVVRESSRFVHNEFEESNITLHYRLTAESAMVLADRIQLEQVILNLLRNACEAVKQVEEDRRRVTIGTRRCDASVEVWVEDTGPGISSEMARRLFEPFATTKLHGMGLGLSISRGIIEAHGGRLILRDFTDRGACFVVSLPMMDGSVRSEVAASSTT